MLRLLFCLILSSVSMLSESDVLWVWPEGKVPGEVTNEKETEVARNDGFQRITHVSRPTLTLFPVSKEITTPTPAIIVCPGGGYRYTVMDKEGSEIAKHFNKAGVTALVLKYRTPGNREGALQDLQRALSLTRSRAIEWKIDPDKIGVIGFSAGGHLAAVASNQFTNRKYRAVDAVDAVSCRPNFAMLVYPAYLDDKQGNVSRDLNLEVNIPPTLIVHSEDDKRHVIGSRIYFETLQKKGAIHSFKLYTTGGHGYGLRSTGEARRWPDESVTWLKEIGIR